ncbi:hypothetical protein [Halanaerobaculum tunisiense]
MKTKAEELIKEIAEELIIYLKAGQLSLTPFLQQIEPSINNFRQLLRIHFILQPEVIAFIEQLPTELRRIKTSSQQVKKILQGEVRGQVDWQQTIKQRYQTNCQAQSSFVCQQRNSNYNVQENLVLKKLLNLLQTIVEQDLPQKDYNWLGVWWGADKSYQTIQEVYLNNSYLQEVDLSQVEVTDRMINNVRQSRRRFYRQAADLLASYRELVDFNNQHKELVGLLETTFIRPHNIETLFELYWVIRLIRSQTDNAQLQLLEGENNLVARWQKQDRHYYLYHDATGSEYLDWQVSLGEVIASDNSYLQQKVAAHRKEEQLAKELFNSQVTDNYWAGRPDIVLEIVAGATNELEKVVIGEVKYTTKQSTARQGLQELLEYLALVKYKGDYLNNRELTTDQIDGLLLVDDVELGTKKSATVKVYNTQDEVQLDL